MRYPNLDRLVRSVFSDAGIMDDGTVRQRNMYNRHLKSVTCLHIGRISGRVRWRKIHEGEQIDEKTQKRREKINHRRNLFASRFG